MWNRVVAGFICLVPVLCLSIIVVIFAWHGGELLAQHETVTHVVLGVALLACAILPISTLVRDIDVFIDVQKLLKDRDEE